MAFGLEEPGPNPNWNLKPTYPAVLHDQDVARVAVGLEEAAQQQHAAVRLAHAAQHDARRRLLLLARQLVRRRLRQPALTLRTKPEPCRTRPPAAASPLRAHFQYTQ